MELSILTCGLTTMENLGVTRVFNLPKYKEYISNEGSLVERNGEAVLANPKRKRKYFYAGDIDSCIQAFTRT